MTPKIEMFDEKIDKFLRFEGSCLYHDGVQKSLFLDFFKVVYDFVGRLFVFYNLKGLLFCDFTEA